MKSNLFIKILCSFLLCSSFFLQAQVKLLKEVKITDVGLHFNGVQTKQEDYPNNNDNTKFDYFFSEKISAHGDCIKVFGDYVFMTWYNGDKQNPNVMLSRYNTKTGVTKEIKFPHKHTGYRNKPHIGESHNTIGIGISPLDGTIHLLYDMHSYSSSDTAIGLDKDYFRYSYSKKGIATISDDNFTLAQFVDRGTTKTYKHLRMPGAASTSDFENLTYPEFFLNDAQELFMYIREGGNDNGAYKFTKYDHTTGNWSTFTKFNILDASNQGVSHNWGLYGDMKYVDGKMRMGFQRRSSNKTDKYQYQNGIYYAYSDDQSGKTQWKNHTGGAVTLPVVDADVIKILEPGDFVQGTEKDKISIIGGFDWTVTDRGDVHFISSVKDNQFNVTKHLHTYKAAGATNFTTTTDFSGGEEIYAAGNDVFLIGLNAAGRVVVQKAEGGKSSFTKVYEATTGPVFNHGQIHIYNGKLYYYLMEDKSKIAQPLYLHIIDLGIQINTAPEVSVSAPTANATFSVGQSILLRATATDPESNLEKVNFKINDVFYRTVSTRPFETTFTPTATGNYKITAIAFDKEGLNAESSITIKVVSTTARMSVGGKNDTADSKTVVVYPNPVTDSFTIDLSDFEQAEIRIYNSIGNLVMSSKPAGKTVGISTVGSFATGIYYIVINDKNGKSHKSTIYVK